ncbi:MAG: GAF domain-containing protein, partial [Candidatus Micrarchaeaceae archaeon]
MRLKDELEAEIQNANVLRKVSTQYIEGTDSYSLFQEIIDAAITITKADKGNIQLLDQTTGKLKSVAHKGFDLPFLKYFEHVVVGEAAACGTAMKLMERVVIEDVTQSPIFVGSDALEVLLNEGVRSVQSTPLVTRSGKLLGILSTHFSKISTLSERELMLVDILARQAADIIEHEQSKHTHRNNLILEGINRIFSIVVQDKTEEELGNECLSVALELTGSQLGFVNLVGDDGLLHDIAISDMGWKQCLMYDQTGHRRPPGNFIVHGLYGSVINNKKSFFTNDPPSHPASIGVPHGHLMLTSFLGVPLLLDDQIKGLIAVANREGGYSHEQQTDLEAIAPMIIQCLDRKKAAEKIQMLANAVGSSEDAIITKSLDCIIVSWNTGAEQIYGYTAGEVLGKSISILEPANLKDETKHFSEKIQRGERIQRYETFRLRKDGTIINVSVNISPVFDNYGKLMAISSIARDITERRQEQLLLKADLDALTRMHELSSKLLGTGGIQPLLDEIMYSAIVIVGAKFGTLQLLEDDSLRIVSYYGHKQPFLDFFASAENVASVCGEAMQRWERVIIEDVETSSLFVGTPSLDVMRMAGVRSVQSTPMVSRTGELLGILTTQWDVPYSPDEHSLWRIDLLARQAADMIEQERSTRKLRESEHIYRAIGESIDYGVWVCDPDGRNTYASPSFLKMVGITQQQCSEFGWGDSNPDDAERTIVAWQECVRIEGVWDIKHRFRDVDGQWHHVLARGIPILDDAGE